MRHAKFSSLFTICFAFNVLETALAQSPRHTITHEDVWMMKRVASPAVSPDGKWTVFSVTEPNYDDSKSISDLWIFPTDGSSAPRKLTNSKGGESGVEWSPDGRRIAFSARREDDSTSQIYVQRGSDRRSAATTSRTDMRILVR